MNGKRLHWFTVGWFGLLAIVNGWIGLHEGTGLVPIATILAGAVIGLAAVAGSIRPDGTSVPAEPGWLLSAGLVVGGLYTIATVFRLL